MPFDPNKFASTRLNNELNSNGYSPDCLTKSNDSIFTPYHYILFTGILTGNEEGSRSSEAHTLGKLCAVFAGSRWCPPPIPSHTPSLYHLSQTRPRRQGRHYHQTKSALVHAAMTCIPLSRFHRLPHQLFVPKTISTVFVRCCSRLNTPLEVLFQRSGGEWGAR